jgi:hypothetical protein
MRRSRGLGDVYKRQDVYNQYLTNFNEATAKREVITRALSFLVKDELTKEKETLLKRILRFIRSIFPKFNTTSSLEKLASTISNDDIQLDYLTTDMPQFNIGVDIKDIYERFKRNPVDNELKKEQTVINGITVEAYRDKSKNIVKRVSDIVKQHYTKVFKNKFDDATSEEKAIWEIQKENGSQIHKDIETLIRFFIDKSTGKRILGNVNTSSFKSVANLDEDYKDKYKEKLETFVRDLMDSYHPDTRFLLENLFINTKGKEKLAGTIDFIAITPDGIDIYDWKTIKLKDGKIPLYKKDGWNIQLKEYKNILKQEFQLSDSDFRYSRVIPILPVLSEDPFNKKIENISIGKVKTKEETNLVLLPYLSDEDALKKSVTSVFLNKLEVLIEKDAKLESKRLGSNIKDYLLVDELNEAIQVSLLKNQYVKLFNFIGHLERKAAATLEEVKNKLADGKLLTVEEREYYSTLVNNLSETTQGLSGFYEYTETVSYTHLTLPTKLL